MPETNSKVSLFIKKSDYVQEEEEEKKNEKKKEENYLVIT